MATALLSVDQLARRWGWAPQRIYRLVALREIPFLKIAGRICFREAVLDAWLEAREQQPASDTVKPARSRHEDCAAIGVPVHHRFS